MSQQDNHMAEAYISVDIEAAGPIPGDYSMLSLGACLVTAVTRNFYVEFKPINQNFVPAALQISGFSIESLTKSGREPVQALAEFRAWIKQEVGDRTPVFVGFNAGFDWSFVNWYFYRFLRENPFGIAPLDIKSFYMGFAGTSWHNTGSSHLPAQYQPQHSQTHNALDDSIAQAEIFQKLLTASLSRSQADS